MFLHTCEMSLSVSSLLNRNKTVVILDTHQLSGFYLYGCMLQLVLMYLYTWYVHPPPFSQHTHIPLCIDTEKNLLISLQRPKVT